MYEIQALIWRISPALFFRVIPSFRMLLDDEPQDGVELERLIAGKNRYMVFSFAFRNVYFSS
jgi:hypothetical protein